MGMRVAILLAFFLCCSVSHAKEVVEIPLNEVWVANMSSHHMPESKKLVKLEPEHYGRQGGYLDSMMYRIARTLSREKRSDTPMRPGFAVLGEGREALEQIHAILVKGETSQDRFPQGTKISAVFFTRQIGSMHLLKIERGGNTFTINYCREPTASNPAISPKVAIIPLGKLAPGKYRVNILGFSKKPDSPKSSCEPITEDRIKNQVCQPYEFEIVESASE
jgi:hypothetical protein